MFQDNSFVLYVRQSDFAHCPDSLIIVDDVSLSLATTGSIVNINSNFSSQFLTTLVTFAIFTLDAGYYYLGELEKVLLPLH